jgi:hypothetical protein
VFFKALSQIIRRCCLCHLGQSLDQLILCVIGVLSSLKRSRNDIVFMTRSAKFRILNPTQMNECQGSVDHFPGAKGEKQEPASNRYRGSAPAWEVGLQRATFMKRE